MASNNENGTPLAASKSNNSTPSGDSLPGRPQDVSLTLQPEQPSSGKKRRAYKDLPPELSDIGPQDISSFVCVMELDKNTDKEVLRAEKVNRGSTTIMLEKLNADQLRLLCRRLGIQGAASAKRDDCRKLIALLQTINTQAATRGDHARSIEQQATNTLFRMINVAFSSEFIERFKELNDAKQRVDYETGNLQTQFWMDVTLSYNDFDEEVGMDEEDIQKQAAFWDDIRKVEFFDVSTNDNIRKTTEELVDLLDVMVNLPTNNVKRAVGELLLLHSSKGIESTVKAIVAKFGWRKKATNEVEQTTTTGEVFNEKLLVVNKYNDRYIQEMVEDGNLNLNDVEVVTWELYRKRFNLLFRIRQKMKQNMTCSGEHDSDPWNFVDVAMNKISGGRKFPKVGILYFFRRCEEYPEIDAAFQTFLDESMKGSTVDCRNKDNTSVDNEERQKKAKTEKMQRIEALTSITTIAANTYGIYKEYQRANATKESIENKKLRIEVVNAEIQVVQVQINVASTLRNTDELQQLSVRLSDLVNELNDLKKEAGP